MMTKMRKMLLGVYISFLVMISIFPVPICPAQAAGYDIGNPRTDKNGVSTWDCIYFGNYYQSNSETKEPIRWRVLSIKGDDAFLLADQGLDALPYHTGQEDVTWETCTLRSWLNGDFYQEAFSSSEQAAIKTTVVVNEDNSYGGMGGNSTEDKIYLLSLGEAANFLYGFPSGDDEDHSKTREARNTEYARVHGAYTVDNTTGYTGNGYWWLRSPGEYNREACLVDCYGSLYRYGDPVSHTKNAVRPVLHLDLSFDTWSKAGTVSAAGGDKAQQAPANVSTEKPDQTGKSDQTVKSEGGKKKIKAPAMVQKLTVKNKKKKSALLSWKKVSGAKGYQLQYATNRKFRKKTERFTKKKKYTVKKLRRKKTYYFRVRAYKQNGKKKVYGKWSKVRKVKIRR